GRGALPDVALGRDRRLLAPLARRRLSGLAAPVRSLLSRRDRRGGQAEAGARVIPLSVRRLPPTRDDRLLGAAAAVTCRLGVGPARGLLRYAVAAAREGSCGRRRHLPRQRPCTHDRPVVGARTPGGLG